MLGRLIRPSKKCKVPLLGGSLKDGTATAGIRVITVTPRGYSPSRLNTEEPRYKVRWYISEMDWAPVVAGVRYKAAELGELISPIANNVERQQRLSLCFDASMACIR